MLALVSVLVVFAVVLVVGGGIALALSGVLAGHLPVLHARLAEIARHLNGDAEAPERVQRMFQG